MAKRPIGKITVRVQRKVTVEQHITHRQQFQSYYEEEATPIVNPVSIQSAPSQTALDSSIRRLESTIKKNHRPAKLPTGVYSPQVEQLYDEINKRSKPDEADNEAMYDVFISHASEDKKDFVQPLVEALQNAGIRVWYDAIELEWGKSLRAQIDNGIKRSKYAILVLSKNFFAKKWPQRELDGILAKEDVTGASPLPIWYNISHAEVYEYSPTLAGLYSLSNDRFTIADICQSFKLILEKEKIKSY